MFVRNRSKLYIIIAVAMVVLLGGLVYRTRPSQGPIYEFSYERDAPDILELFQSDGYWLYASKDFSAEYTLKYKAPNRDARYLGHLHIKVLREQSKLVGFVAYYLKQATIGMVLFLAVKSAYRKKGYGNQLLSYAVQDLIKLGAQRINLLTRTTNFSAQALYKRFGFHETSRDDEGFVYFSYKP